MDHRHGRPVAPLFQLHTQMGHVRVLWTGSRSGGVCVYSDFGNNGVAVVSEVVVSYNASGWDRELTEKYVSSRCHPLPLQEFRDRRFRFSLVLCALKDRLSFILLLQHTRYLYKTHPKPLYLHTAQTSSHGAENQQGKLLYLDTAQSSITLLSITYKSYNT